jgi:membrane protease YdiL (CAAX protease family)
MMDQPPRTSLWGLIKRYVHLMGTYFRQKHDPLASLVFTVPIFLVYHLGILLIELRNGVDLVSELTFRLLRHSLDAYVWTTVGVAAGLFAAGWFLKLRQGRVHLGWILPIVVESFFGAMVMFIAVDWITAQIIDLQLGPMQLGVVDRIILAAGAGFHEELVFRVFLYGGLIKAFSYVKQLGRFSGLFLATIVSSVIFSASHYLGPFGHPLELSSFAFRFFSGIYLAVVYQWRGFAVVVYTHTFYDLLVFFLLMP